MFLKKTNFEPEMLRYTESIKKTTTVGELSPVASRWGNWRRHQKDQCMPVQVTESLHGLLFRKTCFVMTQSVQFFVAQDDNVVCAGGCRTTYNLWSLKTLYPSPANVLL